MGKAILILLVFLIVGIAFIVMKGSTVVAPTDSDGTTINTPSLPDLKVKERASAAGEALKEGAKKTAEAVTGTTESKPTVFKFDREVLEVKAGGKSEFKVMRSGGDMKAISLEFSPAPGSAITASGGTFKTGETSATVSVEAMNNAQDAGLTVRAPGFTKVIPVRVTK